MASVSDLNGIQVENVKFPEQIKPPASAKTLFLGGAGQIPPPCAIECVFFFFFFAYVFLFLFLVRMCFWKNCIGVRELEVGGNSVKFTAIGVYLEKDALPLLAGKWKGKSAAELMDSDEFFRDIVTGE